MQFSYLSESIHPLWNYKEWIISIYFSFIITEAFILFFAKRFVHSPQFILCHSFMVLVEQGLRMFSYALRLSIFALFASLSLFNIDLGLLNGLVLFLLCDFIYYWKHRFWHATQFGWALHTPHHSAKELNLFVAIRLGWIQRLIDDFFYLPLVLLGFHPITVFLFVELNHASQFWCHNSFIPRLKFLDPWLNTPANHRVHHSDNPKHHHANYGSAFMIWDKLFGTYQDEVKVSSFGIKNTNEGSNPIKIQFAPLLRFFSKNKTPQAQEALE